QLGLDLERPVVAATREDLGFGQEILCAISISAGEQRAGLKLQRDRLALPVSSLLRDRYCRGELLQRLRKVALKITAHSQVEVNRRAQRGRFGLQALEGGETPRQQLDGSDGVTLLAIAGRKRFESDGDLLRLAVLRRLKEQPLCRSPHHTVVA